jgi:hypothetical protein
MSRYDTVVLNGRGVLPGSPQPVTVGIGVSLRGIYETMDGLRTRPH